MAKPINHYILNETASVPKTWKFFHILFLSTASLCGLLAGVFLSYLVTNDYILCSLPKISNETIKENISNSINNQTLHVDLLPDHKTNCDFTLYSMIISSIFGVNWSVFFMMCGPGGRSSNGLPQPWRIVLPALLFSSVLFIVDLAAASVLTSSIGAFCNAFSEQLFAFKDHYPNYYKCNSIDLFISASAQGLPSIRIETLMVLGEITTWLCTLAWGLSAFLCCLRVVFAPDFTVNLEYIENITEPMPSTSADITEKIPYAKNDESIVKDTTASQRTPESSEDEATATLVQVSEKYLNYIFI